MKTSIRQLFLGAAIACFFTLTFAALAQEKPAPAVSSAEQPTPAPTPAATPPAAVEPAAPAAPTVTAAPEAPAAKPELRHLDAEPATPAATVTPATPATPKSAKPPTKAGRRARIEGLHITHGNDNSVVSVGHDSFLAKDQQADAVVSVFGSSTSEGEVGDAVVSILGDTRATGPVGNAAVAVLGNTYVNNKVGDSVVAVLGDVELGPDAEVGGDVVSVGGTVTRDPKAIVHGSVQNVSVAGGHARLDGLHAWFRECLLLGRPLALARGLGWVWMFAVAFFALYFIIALLFGSTVDKGVTTLETRPGYSILTAILTVLLTPVLIVLLCITIVGIAAVPFVAVGLLVAGLFGKTVMLAWLGRRFTKFFGSGIFQHAAFAVLIGGVITLGLYCVPVVGIIVQKSFDLLGLGVVVYTLVLANQRAKPAAPSAPPTDPTSASPLVPPTMPAVSPGFGAMGVVAGDPAALGAVAPVAPMAPPLMTGALARPAISAATNPRAGFLIRLAALMLDFILIGILAAFFHDCGKYLLLVVATYGAVMWKMKGTTIGGIVCGLKVVRLDDREIDWATAIIRALGCFLSLAVVGLGFLWVAIDDDKQSWHDKIAGTTVVRVPKGVSLI